MNDRPMLDELDQLKLEINQSEDKFSKAVTEYLLNTQEGKLGIEEAISEVQSAIINYRSALERLKNCLSAIQRNKPAIASSVIKVALARLGRRDDALESLLSRARRKLSNRKHVSSS